MEDKKINISFGNGNIILTIVFILLKAFDKISWSWIWVFAPIWLPLTLIVAIILIVIIFKKIYDFFDSLWFWNRIEDIKSWFWWHFQGGKKQHKNN